MSAKKKKRTFKGGVSRNSAKQSKGAQYGHLNLPKGMSVFKEEPKSRMGLDIMPYEVKEEIHPDRDDEYGIATPGELWYKRPYWLHRNIGANNESVVCPSSAKQRCPICAQRSQLMQEGAEWDDETVKALKPSMRNLYIVIPKDSKDYEETPHIWDISQFLFQQKLNEEIQENEEYETFPDLEEGFTLKIRFSEEQLGKNKFADTSRIDFEERDKPYSEGILDEIPSLEDVLTIPTTKEVEALFFGGLSQDEVDEEAAIQEEDDPFEDDANTGNSDEVEKTEEKEEPKKKKTPAKKDKNKCPHGHNFGIDCEDHDECDDCTMWEDCMDASEEGK